LSFSFFFKKKKARIPALSDSIELGKIGEGVKVLREGFGGDTLYEKGELTCIFFFGRAKIDKGHTRYRGKYCISYLVLQARVSLL